MNLALTKDVIPAMSLAAVSRMREFERINASREQTPIVTHHLLHAGMYHRTISMPADTVLTGALIKIPTVLVFNGDALVSMGDEPAVRFIGYHVFAARAHRKQGFIAFAETQLTMSFASTAKSVEEAEAQFTDEADILFSRYNENVITITGE